MENNALSLLLVALLCQCGSSRVLQRSVWEAESSRDTYELARQKARELGVKAAAALDGKHQAELDVALAAPPVHP